jgi:hypothetical protein
MNVAGIAVFVSGGRLHGLAATQNKPDAYDQPGQEKQKKTLHKIQD